jgi:hypothetical protein
MKTFDTPEPVSLNLDLGVADVSIVASNRVDTVVEVTPSNPADSSDVAAAQNTRVEFAHGVLKITAPKGWKRHGFRGGSESIDVRVELPTGSQLGGDGGVTTLRCSGTLGECRYKTGAGDISIEQVAGTAELTTGTGAVRVDRTGGLTTVKNGNGDTWIGDAEGDLQVKSANGKIAVDQSSAAVKAKTANGDIRLDAVTGGTIVAESACGKVDIALRTDVAAWLDLHTGFGRVRNLLDPCDGPGPSEATIDVRARSSFGDITVRRVDSEDQGQGAA